MVGYKAEEWSRSQIESAFKLPLRFDFSFKLVPRVPPRFDTVAATTLPMYLVDASLCCPNHKDTLTVLAGGFKRLGAKVPPCTYKKHRKILLYARKFIHPLFETFTSDQVPSALEWIASVNQSEKRKQQLREVFLDLQSGIFPAPEYGFKDPRICESFVKDEPYEEEKPPRWINASMDIIKVAFGPYADMCMHRLVENKSFIKTVPVSERAKVIWDDLGGCDGWAQSSDATAMEDHYANMPDGDPRYRISNELMIHLGGGTLVTPEQLTAVKFLFHTTPGLTSVPSSLTGEIWDRINQSATISDLFKNVMDGYRAMSMRNFGHILVNAILCSGEMNTSFKNGASMFTMCNYASFQISRGVHPYCVSKHEGDDALCVYSMKGPDQQWWIDHGWVVKVEFEGKANEASFCGLVFDPVDLVSVPDIRKTLAKFGWTRRKYVRSSYKMRMSLLRSKALSMASEYVDVPILGALAHRMIQLTSTVLVRKSIVDSMSQYERERYISSLQTKNWQRRPNVGVCTRHLVERLQGISVSTQLEIERRFSNLSLSPFSVPELDFPEVWRNNMTRCFPTVSVVPQTNVESRLALIDVMESKCRKELHPRALRKVLRSFDFLRRGVC